eukprot:scaffold29327_cov101-Isochrysis_galbana.AAC.5
MTADAPTSMPPMRACQTTKQTNSGIAVAQAFAFAAASASSASFAAASACERGWRGWRGWNRRREGAGQW